MNHTFNITKFAQQAKQLTELFGVDVSLAPNVEQILNGLDKNDKKYILKFIKDNRIDSPEKLAELERKVSDQKAFSAQKQQSNPTNQLNPDTLAKIQRATNNKQHQQWIASLIVKNVAKDEDIAKLQFLLDEFAELCSKGIIPKEQQNVFDYKTDADIYKIIEAYSQQKEGVFPPTSLGYKVLEDNGATKFLEIFTVEAMAAVAKMRKPMANWCVARNDVQYDPLRYYCLVVNGAPNILVHPESDQIRDYMDDPVSKFDDINMIYPYLIKYKLFPDGYEDFPSSIKEAKERFGEDGENHNEYVDGDLESDFAKLKVKKTAIDQIAQNSDNPKIVSEILKDDISLINCVPKDKWINCFPLLYKNWGISKMSMGNHIIDEINKDLFAIFARWIKINNLDYSKVEYSIIEWIKKDGWGLINYHSKIPDACKSKNVSEFYKKAISNINEMLSGEKPERIPTWCALYVSKTIDSGKIPPEWQKGALKTMNTHYPHPSNEQAWILSSMIKQDLVPEDEKENAYTEYLQLRNQLESAEKDYNASLDDLNSYKSKEKEASKKLMAIQTVMQNKRALEEFVVQMAIREIKNGKIDQRNHSIVMQRLCDEMDHEPMPFMNAFRSKQIMYDKDMYGYITAFLNKNYGKEPQAFLSSFFEYLASTAMDPSVDFMGGVGKWFQQRCSDNDPVFDRYMLNLCNSLGPSSFGKAHTERWIKAKLKDKNDSVEKMVIDQIDRLHKAYYGLKLIPECIFRFIEGKIEEGDKTLVSIAHRYMMADIDPPPFARDWCFKTILSGKAPTEWIEVIDTKVFYIYGSTNNLRLFSDNNFKVLLARHMDEIKKAYPEYSFINVAKEQAKQGIDQEVIAKSWYINYKLGNRI